MFERFTSHARRVLALAQEEARFLGHGYCGSEHLLLGLIRDEGAAGDAVRRQGIQLDHARKAVSNIRGRDQVNRAGDGGSLPFSANAKAAVQAAVDDANAAQSPVDSNHLLFGVLRDKSPSVHSVLHQIRSGEAAREPQPAPVAPLFQAAPVAAQTPTAPAAASHEVVQGTSGSLEARVDDLTRRVDQLQTIVNQLAQASRARQ